MVPVGIGGAGDEKSVQRLARRRQQLRGEPKAVLRAAIDLDRNAPERAQRIAVGRITRAGERDAIAGGEERRERRDQPSARARRQQDALGRDVDVVLLAVVQCDPLAQRSRLPVAGRAFEMPLEVRACGAERRRRRAFARLAEVHRDDLERRAGRVVPPARQSGRRRKAGSRRRACASGRCASVACAQRNRQCDGSFHAARASRMEVAAAQQPQIMVVVAHRLHRSGNSPGL